VPIVAIDFLANIFLYKIPFSRGKFLSVPCLFGGSFTFFINVPVSEFLGFGGKAEIVDNSYD
jgi:hypothetical protein